MWNGMGQDGGGAERDRVGRLPETTIRAHRLLSRHYYSYYAILYRLSSHHYSTILTLLYFTGCHPVTGSDEVWDLRVVVRGVTAHCCAGEDTIRQEGCGRLGRDGASGVSRGRVGWGGKGRAGQEGLGWGGVGWDWVGWDGM